jgi:hypothetical protein
MSRLIRSGIAAVALGVTTALAVPATTAVAASSAATSTVSVGAATAAKPKPPVPTADTSTGPSRWLGKRLKHPTGRRYYPAVLRWANLVLAVMREHRIRPRFLRGILAQIQQESSGNPYAVNRWDSNARAGLPSKGLLQVIAPTYRAYAKPGYRSLTYQTNPYCNIWAALNYVIDRYGRYKFRLWNRGHNQGY